MAKRMFTVAALPKNVAATAHDALIAATAVHHGFGLLARLTHHNKEAYWEAGYAEGLAVPADCGGFGRGRGRNVGCLNCYIKNS